eukprot:TRINITY_DN610_c0_g2_i5.p1 TRINITY_DN610_c0_g2~~TRINITY_DN610_c0_g2_i5.p1  ORF type:complete len:337 (+),score=53.85 TRINITY_DN610_c0_g2_i5:68-1078(+)
MAGKSNAEEEKEKKRKVLEEVICRRGGCAVLDGGLATQLQSHGANINDPLWGAVCLVTSPDLIKQVHTEYLEAGADIIVTASYQATLEGFASKGLNAEAGEALLRKSVQLACEARDSFWEAIQNRKFENNKYGKALVAASIGGYGAFLADGSEYSGDYGRNVDINVLKDFHRRRIQILADAKPDLLAFETIPNKLEAQACIEVLEEEDIQIPSWICFSAHDESHIVSGEPFQECVDAVKTSEKVVGVGINCSPPHVIENLVLIARKVHLQFHILNGLFKKAFTQSEMYLCEIISQATTKAIVVYPNSGEIYDGKTKQWLVSIAASFPLDLRNPITQ